MLSTIVPLQPVGTATSGFPTGDLTSVNGVSLDVGASEPNQTVDPAMPFGQFMAAITTMVDPANDAIVDALPRDTPQAERLLDVMGETPLMMPKKQEPEDPRAELVPPLVMENTVDFASPGVIAEELPNLPSPASVPDSSTPQTGPEELAMNSVRVDRLAFESRRGDFVVPPSVAEILSSPHATVLEPAAGNSDSAMPVSDSVGMDRGIAADRWLLADVQGSQEFALRGDPQTLAGDRSVEDPVQRPTVTTVNTRLPAPAAFQDGEFQVDWQANEVVTKPRPQPSAELATFADNAASFNLGDRGTGNDLTSEDGKPLTSGGTVTETVTHTLSQVESALRGGGKMRVGDSIEIELDPPELGRVVIHLESHGPRIAARLLVDDHRVAAVLEQRLTSLIDSLEAAHVSVDDIYVGLHREHMGSGSHHQQSMFSGYARKQNAAVLIEAAEPASAASDTSRALDIVI